MKMSKIKKLPMLFALVITLVSSLMMSSVAKAHVDMGMDGQYCMITKISGNGDANDTTAYKYLYAAKGAVGTDVLGNEGGGVLVDIQYSSTDSNPCLGYLFTCSELDSTGKTIGNWKNSPLISIPTPVNTVNTQSVCLPASWFTEGKKYKICINGKFPNLGTWPQGSAFLLMIN
ncbi:hypothetical protein LGL55_05810 [Clostridium tagluense]|uniref:hypothetical protein n=1 Tax=Clostridium tagluense TaxID=360422 RepID=UPI001CF0D97A|nr:hypothetical protein [Clostridium tagluense]MCB2310637.1 hypothetical protein [Clostridium tagluense]MCB2315632.1 hypothetical protein [Clostridium tagluense]MCB2320486.1 hypothetical protein [Clostridium tagluense]MCB2325231.1 hypothetical protein [Clostridium tagluense]MCB2330083.1 hypothetical protein [Clostridium tagluense]